MLTQSEMNQIQRENEAQARMAGRDWMAIFAALVLIAAIFGFIYYSQTEGVPANVEPASGTMANAPAGNYSDDVVLERETVVVPPAEAPASSTAQ